jgi:hypothetical protein
MLIGTLSQVEQIKSETEKNRVAFTLVILHLYHFIMMGLAFLKKSKWHQVDREGENLL